MPKMRANVFRGTNKFQIEEVEKLWKQTGCVFFANGSLKSLWSTSAWWKSGLVTLAVGSIAAILAYLVGVLPGNLAVGTDTTTQGLNPPFPLATCLSEYPHRFWVKTRNTNLRP